MSKVIYGTATNESLLEEALRLLEMWDRMVPSRGPQAQAACRSYTRDFLEKVAMAKGGPLAPPPDFERS